MSIKIEDSDSEDDKKEGGKVKEEVSHSSSFMAPSVGTSCQHPEAENECMASEDGCMASEDEYIASGLELPLESPQDAPQDAEASDAEAFESPLDAPQEAEASEAQSNASLPQQLQCFLQFVCCLVCLIQLLLMSCTPLCLPTRNHTAVVTLRLSLPCAALPLDF